MTRRDSGEPCASAELRWLRKVAEHAVEYRDTVHDATRNMPLALGTLPPLMRAKAKLEGALNELRIAREGRA